MLDLKAEYVGVTSVNLTWTVNDTASASYTYRIEVTSDSSIDSLTSSVTMAEITGLIPGTLYNFTVFAVAADNRTEADGASISLYTSKWLFLAVVFLVDCVLLGSAGLCLPA